MSHLHALELSLRDDVAAVETDGGGMVLRGAQGDITFQQLSPSLLDVLRALSAGGMTEQELTALVLVGGGVTGLLQFQQLLNRLTHGGMIRYTLKQGEHPFATVVPLSSRYRLRSTPPVDEQAQQLSRFAYCHAEAGQMVLECSLGHAKIILHTPQALQLIALLAQPMTCAELADVAGIGAPVAATFLDLLHSAKALTQPVAQGVTMEDTTATLAQWEFHDLLFHARTRLGRHRNPYGGSSRRHLQFPLVPPLKPVMSEERIPLYRPDIEQLKQHDPPFSAVLEARRSSRDYDEHPITDSELGEFLYRCARLKHLSQAGEGEMVFAFRPYPAGGALYELEIYALVDQCRDIPRGLYHYDPQAHQLSCVSPYNQSVETLLTMAWSAGNRQSRPQVIFHITARFQRLQGKYQSIAYSLILKHVGVLFQTMYLVATAMELSPCALGGGDSDLFATAAALDYYTETTVGEFMLGSKKGEGHG